MRNTIILVVTVGVLGVGAFLLMQGVGKKGIDAEDNTLPARDSHRKSLVSSVESMDDDESKDDSSPTSPNDGQTAGSSVDLTSSHSSDPNQVKSSSDIINRYVESTGVGQEFQDIDSLLDSQIEQVVHGSDLSAEDKEKIARIFQDHMSGDDLLNSYKSAMAREFTPEEMAQLSKINNHPVVKKLQEEGRQADLSKVNEQADEFFRELEKNPYSKEREELVRQAAQSENNAKFLSDLSFTMMESLGNQMNKEGDDLPDAEMKTLRETMDQGLAESINYGMKYQTRNFSDEELATLGKQKQNELAVREDSLRKKVAMDTVKKVFKEIGEVFSNISDEDQP